MPVIKSAIKKLRKDRKREIANDEVRRVVDEMVRSAKKKKTAESIQKAFSALDKATKKHLLHRNKAARVKSSLAKLIASTSPSKKASATA